MPERDEVTVSARLGECDHAARSPDSVRVIDAGISIGDLAKHSHEDDRVEQSIREGTAVDGPR